MLLIPEPAQADGEGDRTRQPVPRHQQDQDAEDDQHGGKYGKSRRRQVLPEDHVDQAAQNLRRTEQ